MFLSVFSHHKKIHSIFTAATKSRYLVPSSQGSLEKSCRAESTGQHLPMGQMLTSDTGMGAALWQQMRPNIPAQAAAAQIAVSLGEGSRHAKPWLLQTASPAAHAGHCWLKLC